MQSLPQFLLQSFKQSDTYALLEDSKSSAEKSSNLLFCNPQETVIAYKQSELAAALIKIEALKKQGLFLCGYLSYEAGYFFIDKFIDKPLENLGNKANSNQPLLYFIAFKDLHRPDRKQLDTLFNDETAFPESELSVHDLQLNVTEKKYLNIISKIKKFIEAGDTYQINYTIKYKFKLKGNSALLYKALRKTQPVEFGALLNFPKSKIVSLSPELFVRKNKQTLTSKPMKGTAKRGIDKQEDESIIHFLKKDPKTLSENVMIVDLIRNDFGRICKTGSVQVHNLFQVQTFKSIHQMISTVKGTLLNGLSFADILYALFPCGSITGAPKIRTMEIINDLEGEPRGIYTGAIGYLLPNDDFYFNVPIRTIVIKENNGKESDSHCEMGIGSGIIYESNAKAEFAECLLKSSFLRRINKSFYLIEALRFNLQKNSYVNLENHLQRLSHSAKYFGFELDLMSIQTQLTQYKNSIDTHTDAKIRLSAYQDGVLKINHEAILNEPEKKINTIKMCDVKIDSTCPFQYHKTSKRTHYNKAYDEAEKEGYYDALFFNEKNQLAEASRHNVFIKKNSRYFTPPISAGILNGIEREQFILAHEAIEKDLTKQDLLDADEILLTNSVRGIVKVLLS